MKVLHCSNTLKFRSFKVLIAPSISFPVFVSAKQAELVVGLVVEHTPEGTAEAVMEPIQEPAALNLSFHNNSCSKQALKVCIRSVKYSTVIFDCA